MTRELNWSGNHAFEAARLHRPAAVDEVRRIVAGATHAHAIGARHSFNAVADTPGDLIDLRGIAPGFVVDTERRTVTAGGGTSYGELAAHLYEAGWALMNTPSLPHVTVAGATATGTHGSGDGRGTLSADVAAIDLVTATGDLVTVRRGDANFEGAVVNVGALGIVARMTLDIQPAFDMRQDAFEGLSWETVQSDLDAVMSAGYSVSLITSWGNPTVDRLWIKTALTDGAPTTVSAAHLGARPAANPTAQDVPGLNPFGVAGPWAERMPHFRRGVEPGMVGHLQSEILLPRDRAAEAIALLRSNSTRVDQYLLVTELRSMTKDSLWLSPAYGRRTIGFHFSWQPEAEAVARITAEIEAMLLPLGGRPHWGKIIHTGTAGLAPLYPKLQSFADLAKSFDPAGKFSNAFLRRHVFLQN
jgi:xylitol oxidase